MKTAQEIYIKYKIMPSLQLHQLRVGAVAKLVCENIDPPKEGLINVRNVILACLFHDMGNIIKSDLELFPEFRAEKGVDYWEAVKADFVERYGRDAHAANVAIAQEIGLPSTVIRLIEGIGFSQLAAILSGESYELKICEYADTRVGPYGVLTIKERLTEARKRYDARERRKAYYETNDNFEQLSHAALELEKQIFLHVGIKPHQINDIAIQDLVKELRECAMP